MIFPRRHDRYLLAAFWSSLFGVVLFFTAVSVVLDLCERLARLLRNWGPLAEAGRRPGWLLLEFYGSLIPFIWLRIVPFCVPMAAAIALARLARRNELTPLVTAGVSARRVVLPLVLSGFVVAGLLVGIREAAAPQLGRLQMTLGRILTKGNPDRIREVPHFQDPGGARLSMDGYLPLVPGMEGAMITRPDPEGGTREAFWYPRLEWDAAAARWNAPQGGIRFPLGAGESVVREELPPGSAAPLATGVTLLEISITNRATLALSLAESAALVEADPDDPGLLAMHAEQWTAPLTAVVLLLLALPFGFRLTGRGAWPGIGAAMGATGLYYGTHLLMRGMFGDGTANPALVAWAPTVLFASLGFALLLTMDT
jgi:lipopolysaccharide export system permease protein